MCGSQYRHEVDLGTEQQSSHVVQLESHVYTLQP